MTVSLVIILTETRRHGPFYIKPTELPDPRVIINQYKQAAINAKAAGFDGVERMYIYRPERVMFIVV